MTYAAGAAITIAALFFSCAARKLLLGTRTEEELHVIRGALGEDVPICGFYGYGEIKSFRQARPPVGLMRSISQTLITTYGRDFAVASTLFRRETVPGKVGRQMQSWVRFEDGWKVVAAHVSIIDVPKT